MEKKNGYGKEYNQDNKLKYEGEYINGKLWNGKGFNINGIKVFEIINGNGKVKEYDYNGKLLFEGEYLNGEINGKGKEYDIIDGKLEYEGEYLYNKKWNGKGYDENGNIIYELNNGTGKGKEYNYYGKLIFEGEYSNDKRNGRGYEYDNNGNLLHKGLYINGKRKAIYK